MSIEKETSLYKLLGEMLESAKQMNKDKVSELNTSFEELYREVFGPPPAKDEKALEYDNCRQSCLSAFIVPEMYDSAISDAEERYSRIQDLGSDPGEA